MNLFGYNIQKRYIVSVISLISVVILMTIYNISIQEAFSLLKEIIQQLGELGEIIE